MSTNSPAYKILPDIKNKIEKRLKELELKPKSSINQAIKNERHLFSSICYTKTGKKVFFKTLLRNEKHFYLSLLREMKTVKFLTESPAFKNFNITPYLDGNIKDSPHWFTHDYIEGDIIGDFYEIHSPYQNKKYISLIVKNLRVLQSIPKAVINKIQGAVKEIRVVNYKAYPRLVKEFRDSVKEPNLEIDFNKIYEFLADYQNYLPSFKKIITHGDFTLANHIFSKGKIYLTDWEWVRLDNIASDIAHLWIQTWLYPQWRKTLLSTFLSSFPNKEQEEFKKTFRLTTIIQSLAEIRWNAQICKKKYKKGTIAASEKAIQDALRGFNYFL